MNAAPYPSPQVRALSHVESRSAGRPLDPALPLTLNFHPDRMAGGRPILVRLAEDGVYRSQFVTGTGNGGLTARPGGDRWRWESRIFDGAYDDAPAEQRPVYGALNFRRRAVGAAPRFGSAHFRLTVEQLRRHPDYRGAEFVDLGAEIAQDGMLDPRIIADAARTGRYEPQSLKMVWHCLARFGAPPHPTRPIRARNVGSAGV
ncbi:DUF3626 domain-containing protein [Streptomyces atratus]|uniref:DUF3626 domain-containing protein n=1 Tax=Streptomyces atratus TaxID=1893 RepID=UPI00166FD674